MIERPLSCHAKRSGFTLMEMAIVLGIAGMVVGAVWFASSHVRMTHKLQQAQAQLVASAQATRTLFIDQGGVRGAETNMTKALDRLRAFPLEMRPNQASDAGILYHPWSQSKVGSLGSVTALASDCTGTATTDDTTVEPCFSIMMKNVPDDACVMLLSTSNLGNVGIVETIVTAGATTTTLTLPALVSAAKTACASASANTLQWVFLLRDKS